MIERVEVLQDGASAIYGSDAIAGVVNIITKTRQEGFDRLAPRSAAIDDGDGFTQNYQLSWGNGGDGPTQIVVGGNFVKQDRDQLGRPRHLAVPDRLMPRAACDGGCSSGTPLGRFIVSARPRRRDGR